jgi:outer membrane protein
MLATWPESASAESIRQALAAAYVKNPRLDAERARLRATDEEVARAKSGYRPTIEGAAEFGTQRTRTAPTSTGAGTSHPTGFGLTVSQQVFSGFRTTNSVHEAEALVRAGRENLRQVEATVLLDAATAYADVVRDRALVRYRENNLAILTQELNAAEARRAVREVTRTDVAQAQFRRARAASDLDRAKAALKASRAAYERVVGHAPNGVNEPPLTLKQLPRSADEAQRIADQESPNLVSALYREQAARHAVDRVWGELLPEFRVEAQVSHQADPSRSVESQDSASLTGRLNIPLYRGGETHARVRQAKHTHVSRLQEIEQARSETTANVSTAWSRMISARAQLKSDQVGVDAARTALEGVREEEKVGQRTILDVLNAEQELLEAQVQLVTTRREIVVSSYALLAAIGRLQSDSLGLESPVYDPDEHYRETRQNWFGLAITHADGRRELMDVADPEAERSGAE